RAPPRGASSEPGPLPADGANRDAAARREALPRRNTARGRTDRAESRRRRAYEGLRHRADWFGGICERPGLTDQAGPLDRDQAPTSTTHRTWPHPTLVRL